MSSIRLFKTSEPAVSTNNVMWRVWLWIQSLSPQLVGFSRAEQRKTKPGFSPELHIWDIFLWIKLAICQIWMILAQAEVLLERSDQRMCNLKSLKGLYNGLLLFCRRITEQKLTQQASSTLILQIWDVLRRRKFHQYPLPCFILILADSLIS